MSKYISSVSITLCPRDSSLGLESFVICLDYNSGCTILHAMSFVWKNPMVKSYLSRRYDILNITFKYSKI